MAYSSSSGARASFGERCSPPAASTPWPLESAGAGIRSEPGATGPEPATLPLRRRPPLRRRLELPTGTAAEGSSGPAPAESLSAGDASVRSDISPGSVDVAPGCTSSPIATASSSALSSSSAARLRSRAARSARRRSRHCSGSGGGMGVARMASQSNTTSGFCAWMARRASSSKGNRPTRTPGGVRYQYRTRGRCGLPRRLGVCTR